MVGPTVQPNAPVLLPAGDGHRQPASGEGTAPTRSGRSDEHDHVRLPRPRNQLADFTLTVGFYQLVCNFLNTFGVRPEGEGTGS